VPLDSESNENIRTGPLLSSPFGKITKAGHPL